MQRAAPEPLLPSDVEEALLLPLFSVEDELCRSTSAWVGVASAIARCGYSLIRTRIDMVDGGEVRRAM
jgi:hypothetical protein